MARHPKVLILFLGGTTLDVRPRRGSSVFTERDIDLWLVQMGEMDVIASTEGVFVHDGLAAVGMEDWAKTATLIKDRYAGYDGFVVIHQAATLPSAAVALSLMLDQLGKPVVVVSSPLVSPAESKAGWTPVDMPDVSRLGSRANFINALQVAVSDVGEVVVAIGHRLFQAQTFTGPLNQPHTELFGKIDFGVRFFGHPRKRQAGLPRLKAGFESRVAIIEYLPGLDPRYLARLTAGSRGIFLSVAGGLSVPDATVISMSTAAKNIPMLLNGQTTGRVPANVLVVSGDRNSLLIRFLWALGQSRQPTVLRKLMSF